MKWGFLIAVVLINPLQLLLRVKTPQLHIAERIVIGTGITCLLGLVLSWIFGEL